jgi:hypothetical protein
MLNLIVKCSASKKIVRNIFEEITIVQIQIQVQIVYFSIHAELQLHMGKVIYH